jgi:TPR repeat protein
VAVTPPASPQVAAAGPSQIVTRAIPPTAVALAPVPANVPASTATPGQVALARGRRMLDLGNIAAARPLLERSAAEGSGDAAALLGASFDSDWLGKAGVLGIAADATKARYWYDEARKLGVQNIERITTAPKGR